MVHNVIYAKTAFIWLKENACNAQQKSQVVQNAHRMAKNVNNASYNILSSTKQQEIATVNKHISLNNFNANYVQPNYYHVTNVITMVKNVCNVWVSILYWITIIKNANVSRLFTCMKIKLVNYALRRLLVALNVINKVKNVPRAKKIKTLLSMKISVVVSMGSISTSKKNLVACAQLRIQGQLSALQMDSKVYNATWPTLFLTNNRKNVNVSMAISSHQVHNANFVVKEYSIVKFVRAQIG